MSPPVGRKAIASPILLLAALLLGCVVHGSGPVPVRVTASYGVGYFGPPVGFNYGVWGPRYRVAPFHAPVRVARAPPPAFRPAPVAFHPAPVGRPVPSVPRRRR